MLKKHRKLNALPISFTPIFLIVLLLQIFVHLEQREQRASAEELPFPPSIAAFQVSSLGEPTTFARVLMLWLQAFDNQPGISIPFQDLDYERVEAWLSHIIDLDPRGQYPLLAASRLYAEVSDKNKQRQMLDFVAERYLEDPAMRWPWLAHAVVIAKHRIKDTELALKYARLLTATKEVESIPGWAQQMEVFILEDMGEFEAAQILIGGLLSSGIVTDSYEIHFLKERLEQLGAKN